MDTFISDALIGSILDDIEETLSQCGPAAEEGKFVTFFCDGQIYGIPILKVRGIQRYAPMTVVPNMHRSSAGMMWFREELVPVFHYRSLMGLQRAPCDERSPVILLECWHLMKLRRYAVVVDKMDKVVILDEKDIQPLPEYFRRWGIRYITAMASKEGKTVLLVDIDSLIRT